MSPRQRRALWASLPALFLLAIAIVVAAAVNVYANPAGGLQLADPTSRGEAELQEQPSLPQAGFPRTTIDADGSRIVLAAAPRRIVSQSLTGDEYLYLISDPRRVAAVSIYAFDPAFSNISAEVARRQPKIAGDPELAARLRPDLLLLSSTSRADAASQLRGAGLTVARFDTQPHRLAGILENIRFIGRLTGDDARAEALAARFQAQLAAAAQLRGSAPAPRILGLSGRYGYGEKTLLSDEIRAIGGVNVATEHGVQNLSELGGESVLRWDPDWIVVGADPGREQERLAQALADPGVAHSRAARMGRIAVMPNNLFETGSPYAGEFVVRLAEKIYGRKAAQ